MFQSNIPFGSSSLYPTLKSPKGIKPKATYDEPRMQYRHGCIWEQKTPKGIKPKATSDELRMQYRHGCIWEQKSPKGIKPKLLMTSPDAILLRMYLGAKSHFS